MCPSAFPSGGVLNPGDVLVSNWNNSTNVQGTGTTIVRVTPQGQTSLFYQGQGPPGVGLDTALGVLQAGYVVVGAVPASIGTPLPLGMGSLLVLDKSGKVVANLADPATLNGPWDLTINDMGTTSQIFVSDILSGSVTRFDVSTPSSGGFQVTSATQIASGYKFHSDPAAVEVGPTGLAFNPATDTLYVAATADNKVYAVQNAGTAGTQSGTGKVIYKDQTHLHGPLGLSLLPDGNLVAAQGDAVNASKNRRASWSNSPPRASSSPSSRSARHKAAPSELPSRRTALDSQPSTTLPTRSKSGR